MTKTITLTSDEYAALLTEKQSWLADQQLVHELTQQLRVVTVERDLLKQRVDAFLRQLFAAKSEARANPAQRDLFINEAEALAPTGQPPAEESMPDAEVQIAPHSPRNAVVSRWILICPARLSVTNCQSLSGCARTMAAH